MNWTVGSRRLHMLRLALLSILRYFTNVLELGKGIGNLWIVCISLYFRFLFSLSSSSILVPFLLLSRKSSRRSLSLVSEIGGPDSGAFSSENVVQLVTASLVWLLIPWGIEVIFTFKSSAFCTEAVEMSQKSFMRCKYLSQDHSELVETLDPCPLKILYIAKKSQHLYAIG